MTLYKWRYRLSHAKKNNGFSDQDKQSILNWQTCIIGERDSQLYNFLKMRYPTVKNFTEHVKKLGVKAINSVHNNNIEETEKIIKELESIKEENFYKGVF